jgi:hypothetical protein
LRKGATGSGPVDADGKDATEAVDATDTSDMEILGEDARNCSATVAQAFA